MSDPVCASDPLSSLLEQHNSYNATPKSESENWPHGTTEAVEARHQQLAALLADDVPGVYLVLVFGGAHSRLIDVKFGQAVDISARVRNGYNHGSQVGRLVAFAEFDDTVKAEVALRDSLPKNMRLPEKLDYLHQGTVMTKEGVRVDSLQRWFDNTCRNHQSGLVDGDDGSSVGAKRPRGETIAAGSDPKRMCQEETKYLRQNREAREAVEALLQGVKEDALDSGMTIATTLSTLSTDHKTLLVAPCETDDDGAHVARLDALTKAKESLTEHTFAVEIYRAIWAYSLLDKRAKNDPDVSLFNADGTDYQQSGDFQKLWGVITARVWHLRAGNGSTGGRLRWPTKEEKDKRMKTALFQAIAAVMETLGESVPEVDGTPRNTAIQNFLRQYVLGGIVLSKYPQMLSYYASLTIQEKKKWTWSGTFGGNNSLFLRDLIMETFTTRVDGTVDRERGDATVDATVDGTVDACRTRARV